MSIVLSSLLGCGTPPPSSASLPHFDEWDRLVPAVLLGRRQAYLTMVRSLAGPDSADVGAATGYLQVVGAAERSVSLMKLAMACGGCHGSASVQPPTRPATHRYEAVVALDRLVFPRLDQPVASANLDLVLRSCGPCHDDDGRIRVDLE